jgi:hypothetical protein
MWRADCDSPALLATFATASRRINVGSCILQYIRRKFSNRREWRNFVSAVQCSVNYPAVLNALRNSAWPFNDTVVARVAAPVALTQRIK